MSKRKAVTAAEEAAMKMIAKIEHVLDAPDLPLTPRDLSVIADALRHAAQVLGVQTTLDDEEQRAKIAVLVARADGEGGGRHGPVEVVFDDEADEAAR